MAVTERQLRQQRMIKRAKIMVGYRQKIDMARSLYESGAMTVEELISAVQTSAIDMTNKAATCETEFLLALKELNEPPNKT
jgi:hypothetical protein